MSVARFLRFKLLRDLRVVRKNLFGEGHLVNDTLTGAVAAVEKLKVLDSVVGFDAVDVVNRFFARQAPTDVLLHDASVLKNVSSFFAFRVRNGEAKITMPGWVRDRFEQRLGFSCVHKFDFPNLLPAGFAASGVSAFAYPGCREGFSAEGASTGFDAGSTDAAAFKRAIHRVFAESLVIAAKLSRVSAERFSAVFALELNRFHAMFRSSVGSQRSRVAGHAAIFAPVSNIFGARRKRFGAVLACERFALPVASARGDESVSATGAAEFDVKVLAHSVEDEPAVLARTLGRGESLIGVSAGAAVLEVAFARAENAMGFLLPHNKRFLAVLADSFDRHWRSLVSVEDKAPYYAEWGRSTVKTNGAL